MRPNPKKRRSLTEAVGAGLLGGLAATVAMNAFQNVWNRISERRHSSAGPSSRIHEPTDIETCQEIASRFASLCGLNVSDRTLRSCALAMHYGFGAGAGAVYGLAREIASDASTSKLSGMALGSGVGLAMLFVADQFAIPALGLRRRAVVGGRLYGIASHLVYGMILGEIAEQSRALITTRSQ